MGLLDLLLELQALDRVPRTGYQMRGVPDPESVTEHSWHVLFLVWAVAARLPKIDRPRAMELALIHDVAELRLGDLTPTARRLLPPGAKSAAELQAASEMLAAVGERERELAREALAGETAEARLVRACDRLQRLIKVTVYEQRGTRGLEEFWDGLESPPDGGFAPLAELFAELSARRHER